MVSRNQIKSIQAKCDWGHTRCRPAGVCYADSDGERIMTLVTFTDHLLPGGVESFGNQDREESDGLFLVVMWSIAGVTLTALTIWLGLGGQMEGLIGLG